MEEMGGAVAVERGRTAWLCGPPLPVVSRNWSARVTLRRTLLGSSFSPNTVRRSETL